MPRARPVTGLLVFAGVVAGVVGALVWHLAAAPVNPGWLPTLALFSGTGAAVGWFVAACANAEGWRVVRAPVAGPGPLVVAVCGTALVAGLCLAWVWSLTPPPLPPAAGSSSGSPAADPDGDTPVRQPGGLGTPLCGDAGVMCVFVGTETETETGTGAEASAPPVPERVGVGSPWLTLPILSVLVSSATAVPVLAGGVRVVRWAVRRD